MIIRKYKPADCKMLAELFYHTVHTVNAKDYTKEQLNAWASGNIDLTVWNQSFTEHDTVVAIKKNLIVGFGDMDKSGYFDRLYVHEDYQHQGIGSAICQALESNCPASEFSVHASITAQPFFISRGYQVIQEQKAIRNGVSLTNYLMRKSSNPINPNYFIAADKYTRIK